jgi:hypothetical protein
MPVYDWRRKAAMSAGRTFDFSEGPEINCRVRYTPNPIDLGEGKEKYHPWSRLLSVTAKIESGRLVASRYDNHVLALVDEVVAPLAEIDYIEVRQAWRARLPAVPIFMAAGFGLYLVLKYAAPWLLSLLLLIFVSLKIPVSIKIGIRLDFLFGILGWVWGRVLQFWSRVMWTEFVVHTRDEKFSLCVGPRRETEMVDFLRGVGLPVAKSAAGDDQ